MGSRRPISTLLRAVVWNAGFASGHAEVLTGFHNEDIDVSGFDYMDTRHFKHGCRELDLVSSDADFIRHASSHTPPEVQAVPLVVMVARKHGSNDFMIENVRVVGWAGAGA